MLRSVEDLVGHAIEATDGPVGHVKDFYFDDATWTLRYFVVDTGVWLAGRKVLVSPICMGAPDDLKKVLPVTITQAQVRNSPDLDTARPVSRQHEKQFMASYGYPAYWGGTGLWGDGGLPNFLMPTIDPITMMRLERDADIAGSTLPVDECVADPHLRSFATVATYRLQARDGEIGHVRDLLVDDTTWAIRYLVVATGSWGSGHRALIAPSWTREIDWFEGTIAVDLTRREIESSPHYDPRHCLDRDQEEALHRHYGRSGYWLKDPDFEPALNGS